MPKVSNSTTHLSSVFPSQNFITNFELNRIVTFEKFWSVFAIPPLLNLNNLYLASVTILSNFF